MADYRRLIDSIDGLVIGRKTYEKVLTFGAWHYTKPVVVLSTRGIEIPPELHGKIESMAGTPEEVLSRLCARVWSHAYIDGGQTIQGFLRAGRIQRLVVTWVPILLGTGIPLFGPLESDIKLRHVKSRSFQGGLVQNAYDVL